MTARRLAPIGLMLVLALAPTSPTAAQSPDVGKAYQVPYRLTLTNHYLVRVKIDGKGPFNFLVDTGAPYLFVSTEAARKIGLEPAPDGEYWTKIGRFDLEGGASLKDIKARVEDPFQLVGMNALGLPGASIDGILGFTILARFKMEFDPTRDRMTWTRLDYDPKEPFVPRNAAIRQDPEVQAMNALGPIMKVVSVFVGKQPEDVLHPQGLLGIEFGDALEVKSVLPDSPASRAGVQVGDLVKTLQGKALKTSRDAHEAIAPVRPGDRVEMTVDRGDEEIKFFLNAAEGL